MWFWDYSGQEQFPYGSDDTYKAAAEFLDGGPVEDWGCGTAYAKRFFPKGYTGIDRAGPYADLNYDISLRKPCPGSGVLLRHVLEHNFHWPAILKNALEAKKVAIVIFTPFEETTHVRDWTENERGKVPNISFRKEDLTSRFPKYTEQAFGTETIFLVETHA